MAFGDGIQDDTAAVNDYIDNDLVLPAGTFRITAPIERYATAVSTPGWRLRGRFMRSTILADFNGTGVHNAVVQFGTTGASMYHYGSEISGISIVQASGRSNLNGILLTAAWYTNIVQTSVTGMTINGLTVPLRPDISPISDYYQGFAVRVLQSQFNGNVRDGVDFAGGQSPGNYIISQSFAANNGRCGIHSTTGQCRVEQNVVVGNGSNGTLSGGILFDSAEGPSMVAQITQNEVQDNYNWNLALLRSRGAYVARNRFLSAPHSAAQGGSRISGGAYMRPMYGVNLGSGATNEVYDCIFEQNLFRSVLGPNAATANFIGFGASGGSLDATYPVTFHRNSFGPEPFDGMTQNSTATSKYIGAMPGAIFQ